MFFNRKYGKIRLLQTFYLISQNYSKRWKKLLKERINAERPFFQPIYLGSITSRLIICMGIKMEIERKFLVRKLPNLDMYSFHEIEQAYLCTEPVVRVRKEDDNYYMTYKAKGFLEREEYNLPLTEESYLHLLSKADGNVISKKRYLIEYLTHTIELDIFSGVFEGLIIAEVEFDSRSSAEAFIPPEWFGADVTFLKEYHNSYLSSKKI